MYHEGRPLEAVIRELMVKLEASRDRFDEAASRIQKIASRANDIDCNELLKYIDGLRTNATGTIEFWYALIS